MEAATAGLGAEGVAVSGGEEMALEGADSAVRAVEEVADADSEAEAAWAAAAERGSAG